VLDSVESKINERYLIKREYKPITILAPSNHFINSGSNSQVKGGKSRIIIPIQIPNNTIEWYYTLAASREQEAIEKTNSSLNLFGQLSNIIDPTGISAAAFKSLIAPPGADVCDLYILDAANRQYFEAKTNFKYFT
jgi:hypothetical protein